MNRPSSFVAAVVLVASGALFAQSQAREVPKEFEHVRTLGSALSEYKTDLATQARWAQDSTRNALLLQRATVSRHQVATYFRTSFQTHLRFFTRPPDDGLVQQTVHLMPYELALGDLLFESPTGLWDKGTHALVIRFAAADAVLPIELR